MATFQELLDHCAFQVYERQNRLALLVGDRDWQLDTETGIITFGEDLAFAVQFQGTFSEESNTWLWADANKNVAFPTSSLEYCRKVRSLGRDAGIEEFGLDHFPFSDKIGKPDPHSLAMVAVSLGGASAYYYGSHDAGAVVMAIIDPRIESQPDLDRVGFINAFNNLMWQPGDMKKRIVSYLSEKGCIAKDWDGEQLDCKLPTGELIGLTFKKLRNGGMKISFKS